MTLAKVISPMPPTKLLYVITKSNWGGAQRYVYDLALAAREKGHDVAVVAGGAGPLIQKLEEAGIRTISLPLRQRRSFIGDLLTFGSLFSLIRIFKAERPHIVHTNSAKAGGLGNLAARLTKVPLIVFTAHGWEFNAPRNILSKVGIALFSWITVLLSHRTIAVSHAIRHDVRFWPGVSKRMSVIRNGIDTPALKTREEARAALGTRAVGRYWVGMISELNATKDVATAIRAFALLVPKHPDAVLVVMGEGAERGSLEDLIRDLHLRAHVSLVGHTENAASLLPGFDLFLHTSLSEALCYVILEAGAASLPVVATRVGGIPEMIPDDLCGLLVPAKSPEAVAEAIETLMSDPSRAKHMGEALHTRVRTEFSKEKMLTATLALYP